MTALDPKSYREFFGQLPTGVTAIVAGTPQGTVGLVVGTFSSVSLKPPLVSFMVTSGSRSWAAVKAAGRFTANILASDQRALSQTLSGWSPDKFRSVRFDDEEAGIINGCLAWADLATPYALTVARASRPLIFFQRAYHRTLPVEDFRAPGWA